MLPSMKGPFSQLYAYDNVTSAQCGQKVLSHFLREMDKKLWRVDALLVASAIMAGVIVGIGAYVQRYRHHHLTRFIFLGATTLFLPIISSVVSSGTVLDYSSMSPFGDHDLGKSSPALVAVCNPAKHSVLVVTWALLVQNVMINTSVVVVVDKREGASIAPPMELLAQGLWTLYLGISHLTLITSDYPKLHITVFYLLELLLFVLTVAKLAFKYYAVKKARHSFAFRRNPRLVFGYMRRQLHPMVVAGQHVPPALLVMGEETEHVEMQPQGYVFKYADDCPSGTTMLHKSTGLVTIDRVWLLLDKSSNSTLLPAGPTPQSLKDLCLSFALFKLLRCRFARYEIAVAGSNNTSSDYFWNLLLKDGEPDRVFEVITDELSFLHDYYYSSLPISYSKLWLPIVGFSISLLSIGYCIFLSVWMVIISKDKYNYQIVCHIRCQSAAYLHLGILKFDVLPLAFLLVFVVTAEVRSMVSYIFSNWTKVVITCRLLVHNEQQPLSVRKWYSHLLRFRCKPMMKHWDEKMGQCSVLPLHRGRAARLRLVIRRVLHLPDHKTKLNAAVKASIMDVLRSSNNGPPSNVKACVCHMGLEGESRSFCPCKSNSVSDIIVTWHIATSILEVKYPNEAQVLNDHRVVATHLSGYCAYLVIHRPHLLPDDDAWSMSLYKAVKKDAHQALAQSSSTPDYEKLVQLLSAKSTHKVLKDGVKLGEQLVKMETTRIEKTAWKQLANFWSEMILYVAPSDNLKGHKEYIARGGELITLLWVLLNHARIDRWQGHSDDTACPAGVSAPAV